MRFASLVCGVPRLSLMVEWACLWWAGQAVGEEVKLLREKGPLPSDCGTGGCPRGGRPGGRLCLALFDLHTFCHHFNEFISPRIYTISVVFTPFICHRIYVLFAAIHP